MEMSPKQWERVKELYTASLNYEPTIRDGFLRRNESDSLVVEEVCRLLAQHPNAKDFLSSPFFTGPSSGEVQHGKRFPPGEILAERFRINGFIAAGGMGEVYKAEDI